MLPFAASRMLHARMHARIGGAGAAVDLHVQGAADRLACVPDWSRCCFRATDERKKKMELVVVKYINREGGGSSAASGESKSIVDLPDVLLEDQANVGAGVGARNSGTSGGGSADKPKPKKTTLKFGDGLLANNSSVSPDLGTRTTRAT